MDEENKPLSMWAPDEVLDMSELYDLQFAVAINRGHRDDTGYVCSTLRGPFDFDGMISRVHSMWSDDLDHAKVIILDDNPKNLMKVLDHKTTEYIEMRAMDILMDRMLGVTKTPTASAGFSEASPECPKEEEEE
jgi:hypothetical protein